MAVNVSRNMRAELELGIVENTFMQLQPDWSINANPPTERLQWPTYQQAMRHGEGPKETVHPITPREAAPAGGMYSSPSPTGGQGSKFSLVQALNAS